MGDNGMILNDQNILNEIVNFVKKNEVMFPRDKPNPLDRTIIEKIDNVKDHKNLYQHYDEVYELWIELIEKSIKCLRYYDDREPFKDHSTKEPVVHGMDKLADYFQKYSDFEGLLYGADKYYRDHVFHVFRTWATGVYIMLSDDMAILKAAKTDGEPVTKFGVSPLEFLSMWTIAALCHDLGYPLEKARNVIAKTKDMTQSIIGDSEIWADLSFSGIQEEINLLILRFISSKMLINPLDKTGGDQYCIMRVQPKYYIKLCKSLEKYAHGILSAIVLSKTLVYFIEAEFGVNEDYYFKKDDYKQFYVKREILRAIAFHTCTDIYHMSASSLSFLLILSDEVQNWDRRSWNELYEGIENATTVEFVEISPTKISVKETLGRFNAKKVPSIVEMAKRQFEKLKTILRDGIETFKRDFDFRKAIVINVGQGKISIVIDIPKDSSANLFLYNEGVGESTIKESIMPGVKKFCAFETVEEDKYRIC
jgi:hypothetical protein